MKERKKKGVRGRTRLPRCRTLLPVRGLPVPSLAIFAPAAAVGGLVGIVVVGWGCVFAPLAPTTPPSWLVVPTLAVSAPAAAVCGLVGLVVVGGAASWLLSVPAAPLSSLVAPTASRPS